ncbi:SpoIIE family protein phosphatase [Nonomuraea terrae]|uniref:SpoIIE family protein phosphatase n=1 Tax=Nonomuraea terrae TaxID=2530383 RepID=UPI0037B494A2
MGVPDTTGHDAELPAIAIIESDGTLIGWTRAAERLLGYRAADVVGRSGALLLTPGDHHERLSAWARQNADLDRWSGLAEIRHRAGHPILLHVQGHRLAAAPRRGAWLLSANTAAGAHPAVSVLEPLVDRSPAALWIWDGDLRRVWCNGPAQRMETLLLGVGAGDLPEFGDVGSGALMRRVLSDGIPVIDAEIHRPAVDGQGDRMLSMSVFRLDGVDGQPIGVCTLAIDVTQSLARKRLALLIEASGRIGTTLDVCKTAQELADLAMPALADYVTVDLSEAVVPSEEPPLRPPEGMLTPAFRRAGMASIHTSLPETLWRPGVPVIVPLSAPQAKVLYSGRSHLDTELDLSPGTWFDHDPDRARLARETGMHSVMIVPVLARGEILGITVFVRSRNPAPFTPDDLVLAEQLVARAALSLDSARRYTRERDTARALQRHLLPRSLSGCDAVELAARYLASDVYEGVGGGWFDAISLPRGRIALTVGDVSGRGVNAAATMGRMRTAIRTLASVDLPPDELLTHLDELTTLQNSDPDLFISAACLYAVYDPATRRFVVAAAANPPPAIVCPGGEATFARLNTGASIGLGLGRYEALDLELPVGSLIVLHTEGLVEKRDSGDPRTGQERLRAALSAAPHPLEELCTSVIDTMMGGSCSGEDDVALLVARTR